MAEEIKPNGDEETGGERLDRIERALSLMLDDHIQFGEEHKLLLSAQVQMQGGLETLRDQTKTVTGQLETVTVQLGSLASAVGNLASRVDTIVTEFREFGHQVDTMRNVFDQRLKRIEG
jgi:phage-related protein